MDAGAFSTVSVVNNVTRKQVTLKSLLAVLTSSSNEVLFSSALTFITRKELDVYIRVNCYHSWGIPDDRGTPHGKVQTEYRYHRSGYDHGEVLQVTQALSTCPTLTHVRVCVDQSLRISKYNDLMSVVCKTLYYNENLITLQLAIGTLFGPPNINLDGQITKISPSGQEFIDHVSSILEENKPVIRSLKVQLAVSGSTKAHSYGGNTFIMRWETPLSCLSLLCDHLHLETVSTKISKNVLKELVLSLNIQGLPDNAVIPALVEVATTQLCANPNLLKLSFTDSFLLNNTVAKVVAKALRANIGLEELSANCWMSGVGKLVSAFSCNETGQQGNISLHSLKIKFVDLYFQWPHSQGSIMKEVASMLRTNSTLTHVEVYPLFVTAKAYHKKTAKHIWNLVNQLANHNDTLQYFNFGVWNRTTGLWTLQRIGADLHTTFKGVPHRCWKRREPDKEYTIKLSIMDD